MLKRIWRRILRYGLQRGPEIAVFVLLLTLLGIVLTPRMIYTIPAGHTGVLWRRFGGTVVDSTIGEGLAIVLPWNRVYIYDLRLQIIDRDFDVLSADGLKLSINIAYRFRLVRNQVPLLHQNVGTNYADILLTSAIGSRARDIFGRNTPEDIYSYRRSEIQTEILKAMQENLQQSDLPHAPGTSAFIQLEDVFIRSITLPPAVTEAIDQKNQMQQRNLEYDYRLLLESKESERKRIEAMGIREFQDIVSQGITESYLRWKGIDATLALANSPNSKTVIIGGGRDGLPIILGNTDGVATAPAAAPSNAVEPTPPHIMTPSSPAGRAEPANTLRPPAGSR